MRRVLISFDERIAGWMEQYGHFVHRVGLGLMFVWFGCLKIFVFKKATTNRADPIYWGDHDTVVPMLRVWDVAIGLTLLVPRPAAIRVSLALLSVRLCGTLLALVLKADVCFDGSVLVPTPQGQYLIKDALLFGAAMVIGGTIRLERKPGVLH